jgi:iron complex outermembrane receptor protein
MLKRSTFFVPVFLLGHSLYAQIDSSKTAGTASDTSNANVFDLSLEDLMDVKVVSASKKSESAFDAPLSIGSISKDEIKKSGALSIMEALRLIPGLIVRESSNGNYDVFIRGFENLPPGTTLNAATNSISLVMIDNRPVYNYFNGGTFWETLPVDLNDVENIEVVKGPSSAMYGPNAANGVINIITRKPQKEGLYAVANAQGGTVNTYVGNGSIGYKKDKFSFIVSGNYQNRKRTEDQYYSWSQGKKVDVDSVKATFPPGPLRNQDGVPNTGDRYPSASQALNKYGVNVFANYAVNDKVGFGLSAGGQGSSGQVAFIDNLATPLSYRVSNTKYADLKAKVYGLNAQVSYQGGTQDVSKGYNGYKYNFSTLDALAEYDINIKRFSFKPGINYRTANYNDSKYADVSNLEGFLNGSKTLNNLAGSLRAEYDDKKMFKFIAAVRYDTYNYPSAGYTSFQFAGNLKINENNLFRAVYSRAYRGPTMYDTYSSQSLLVGSTQANLGPPYPTTISIYAQLYGNNNLNLQRVDMFELGYRLKATEFLHFDLEAFYQVTNNYSQLVNGSTSFTITDPAFRTAKQSISQRIENISMKAEQTGFTLGANFVFKKLQFKPFVTVQQTFLYNVPQGRDSATINTATSYSASNNLTPSVYGGAYLNYQISSKFNLNVNAYYYNAYQYTSIYTLIAAQNAANGNVSISDKVIMNAKLGYKVIPKLEIFLNARNALNAQAQEFANTDITKGIYLVGGSFEF